MNKEKFHIPMPDEQIIEQEINKVVKSSFKRQPSFLSFLKEMYEKIGMRHLFSDRTELTFILFTAILLLVLLASSPSPAYMEANDVYAFLFLVSPIMFIVFSIYTYVNKIQKATYEVEMTCKYHLFQIIAFRMLVFSVVTILFNTFIITAAVIVYEDVHFLRAFVISTTALFSFSILFLYVLMKRRSTPMVTLVVASWILGNLFFRSISISLYDDLLVGMPLVVYAIVTIGSVYVYIGVLKKIVQFNRSRGVI